MQVEALERSTMCRDRAEDRRSKEESRRMEEEEDQKAVEKMFTIQVRREEKELEEE